MEVREHAKKRMRERCGLPKRAIERNAEIALRDGLKHAECTGRLKKYVDYLFLSHKKGGKIRLFNNHVYIFTVKEELITVVPLPKAHRDAVKKTIKRRKSDDA